MAKPRAAVLVPNLFTRVPIDTALRAAGAVPIALDTLNTIAAGGYSLVVVDLDAAGDAAIAAIEALARSGTTVLAFGPHVDADRLAAARRAGAVVLPRGAFLAKLPELLAGAL